MPYDPFNLNTVLLTWNFFAYPNSLVLHYPWFNSASNQAPQAAGVFEDTVGLITLPISVIIRNFSERQRYRTAASGVATTTRLQVGGVTVATLNKAAGALDPAPVALSRFVPAGTTFRVEWQQLALVAGFYSPQQTLLCEVSQ